MNPKARHYLVQEEDGSFEIVERPESNPLMMFEPEEKQLTEHKQSSEAYNKETSRGDLSHQGISQCEENGFLPYSNNTHSNLSSSITINAPNSDSGAIRSKMVGSPFGKTLLEDLREEIGKRATWKWVKNDPSDKKESLQEEIGKRATGKWVKNNPYDQKERYQKTLFEIAESLAKANTNWKHTVHYWISCYKKVQEEPYSGQESQDSLKEEQTAWKTIEAWCLNNSLSDANTEILNSRLTLMYGIKKSIKTLDKAILQIGRDDQQVQKLILESKIISKHAINQAIPRICKDENAVVYHKNTQQKTSLRGLLEGVFKNQMVNPFSQLTKCIDTRRQSVMGVANLVPDLNPTLKEWEDLDIRAARVITTTDEIEAQESDLTQQQESIIHTIKNRLIREEELLVNHQEGQIVNAKTKEQFDLFQHQIFLIDATNKAKEFLELACTLHREATKKIIESKPREDLSLKSKKELARLEEVIISRIKEDYDSSEDIGTSIQQLGKAAEDIVNLAEIRINHLKKLNQVQIDLAELKVQRNNTLDNNSSKSSIDESIKSQNKMAFLLETVLSDLTKVSQHYNEMYHILNQHRVNKIKNKILHIPGNAEIEFSYAQYQLRLLEYSLNKVIKEEAANK
jgi:hypothetical protein